MAQDDRFIACLLLHQHRRDTAIGLSHVTTKQTGLIWYYNELQRQIRHEYIKSAIVKERLTQIQARIKQILKEAKTASLEQQKALLSEAMRLQDIANQWLN